MYVVTNLKDGLCFPVCKALGVLDPYTPAFKLYVAYPRRTSLLEEDGENK